MAIIKKFRIKSFKKGKTLVKIKNISLSFGKRQILDDVSFAVNSGEICGLLGPNGVGKSTIFNLITGLIQPNYGSIFFENINATNYPIYLRTTKFKIGYVPQHGGYFSDLTLLENLNAIGEILIKDDKKISDLKHLLKDLMGTSLVEGLKIIESLKIQKGILIKFIL